MQADQVNGRVQIAPASWRDLNAVRRLERLCFPLDTWPLLEILGILTLPGVLRLKALVDGDMVGFLAAEMRPGRSLAWIATIGVLPEYRQQGLGRALMQDCEARLGVTRIRLSVRASNLPAIRLYEGMDYRQVDIWPRYYQGGEDAVVMEKVLS